MYSKYCALHTATTYSERNSVLKLVLLVSVPGLGTEILERYYQAVPLLTCVYHNVLCFCLDITFEAIVEISKDNTMFIVDCIQSGIVFSRSYSEELPLLHCHYHLSIIAKE